MANLVAPNRPRRVAARRQSDEGRAVGSEDLHLRNYDAHHAYEPTLVVTAPDGEALLRRRYRIPPGQCRSERDLLPDGAYAVRAWIEGRYDDRDACRLDDDPDAAALVGLGNGVVTVSAGIP